MIIQSTKLLRLTWGTDGEQMKVLIKSPSLKLGQMGGMCMEHVRCSEEMFSGLRVMVLGGMMSHFVPMRSW